MNKSLFSILLLTLLLGSASAAEKSLCEIEWKKPDGSSTTLQFAWIEKGCALESASREDCYVVRKKDAKNWTLGEGLIRKSVAPSTLCLAPELYKENEIQATLICDAKKKPKSIRLDGPGSATKTCSLPKKFP